MTVFQFYPNFSEIKESGTKVLEFRIAFAPVEAFDRVWEAMTTDRKSVV